MALLHCLISAVSTGLRGSPAPPPPNRRDQTRLTLKRNSLPFAFWFLPSPYKALLPKYLLWGGGPSMHLSVLSEAGWLHQIGEGVS